MLEDRLRITTENLKRSMGVGVRATRKRTGLSHENLAAVSRTPESISNIEQGQQLPNLETLSELARVLGVPLAEFFERIGEERRGQFPTSGANWR